jgi:hypothetical protein
MHKGKRRLPDFSKNYEKSKIISKINEIRKNQVNRKILFSYIDNRLLFED